MIKPKNPNLFFARTYDCRVIIKADYNGFGGHLETGYIIHLNLEEVR